MLLTSLKFQSEILKAYKLILSYDNKLSLCDFVQCIKESCIKLGEDIYAESPRLFPNEITWFFLCIYEYLCESTDLKMDEIRDKELRLHPDAAISIRTYVRHTATIPSDWHSCDCFRIINLENPILYYAYILTIIATGGDRHPYIIDFVTQESDSHNSTILNIITNLYLHNESVFHSKSLLEKLVQLCL